MIELIITLYLSVGILLALIGPAKKSIAKAVDEIKPTIFDGLNGRKETPKYKIYLFKIIITSGFVVLWPILLSGVKKDNSLMEVENDLSSDAIPEGINFSLMGGHGTISCKNCLYSKEITSFIHGRGSCTTGFQCQSCGKFKTRSRKEPFEDININDSQNLLDFKPSQRARQIEHMLSMISMCEDFMVKTPKNKWLLSWEPTVKNYREKLSLISENELKNIRKKRESFERKYEASLVCGCGGKLDRDKTLFCPECKSKNLGYFMEYIT